MCNFFSLVSNGKGTIYYFNWKQRQKILRNELKIGNHEITEADSHSSIIEYLKEKRKYIGNDFDKKFNMYEFNPLTKIFQIDQINVKDDSEIVRKKCMELDFRKIVKPLIIKNIINPFQDKKRNKVTKKEIELLKQWASVWDLVKNVAEVLVGNVIWDVVLASVGSSVRNSAWAYISSFFDIKYDYDFSSCIKLWESGLVPSYNGAIWRLHGYQGKILWEEK